MTRWKRKRRSKCLRGDVSHLVTEDDTPVDSIFSQIQMRLLTEPLRSSWRPGREFVASNVGVPDMLLSLDVRLPENTATLGGRRRQDHSHRR